MKRFAWIKEAIKDECLRMGACGASISGPRPSNEDFLRYDSWIRRGNAADMRHLSEKAAIRRDTRNLWPLTESVVCIAVPFDCNPGVEKERIEASGELKGYVASYARSLDYHGIVRSLLHNLEKRISSWTLGEAKCRVCVDTSPILERSLAGSSGLGRIGRNNCLIVPGIGSRVVLGELLLNLELEPDQPLGGDPCEECSLCIDACPTGALNEGLISARCLSYVTIEHRSVMQKELSVALENRFFGCDTCLSVCPHNEKPLSPEIASLETLSFRGFDDERITSEFPGAWLNLHQAAGWGSGEIRRCFKNTALSRITVSMFRRNLCENLGNIGCPDSQELLAKFLNSPSETVRKTAERAWLKSA